MRVILMTSFYPPEIAASIYLVANLAEDLACKGFKVDVVTTMPIRGVDKDTIDEYKNKKTEILYGGNLTIHRVNIGISDNGSFIKRALRSLLVTWKLFFKGITIKGDLIFCYSTPPTLGIAAILAGKIKRIKVIYNLQDIFPDSLINTGKIEKGPLLKLGRLLEKASYKGSDKIVVISKDFKRIIMERGVHENKIDLIYNWVDENEVVPVPREQNILIPRYNLPKDAFYITYCGNTGFTQNLELLIDVAKSLENLMDFKFVILGDGANKSNLINYARDKDACNVIFLPFQPYEEISHVFSLGDVGVIISKKGIGGNSFPSKTWSIMSAARPVLASFDEDSELCEIINNAQCGRCVPPEDFNALRKAVLYFYYNRQNIDAIGLNGRKYILNNLSRKAGTEKYYKILKNACNEDNHKIKSI